MSYDPLDPEKHKEQLMNKTNNIWADLDIEAIQILVIVTVLSLFLLKYPLSIYATAAIALLPQGRILMRALSDRPMANEPVHPYLFINEAVVMLVAALYALGWYWLH